MTPTQNTATDRPTTDDRPAQHVLSREATSEGVVVWTRCECGRVQMALLPYGGGERNGLSAGRHEVRCPWCTG